jgi:DNA-directed RNA polymerase subunit beta'
LGIQAFEPTLIEGKAIQLHPLVCTAFNADFDGDQMAVHVPLSVESQIEARVLMLSSNNILSPANGSPIIVPSQDIVLGLYYMTRGKEGCRGEGKIFSNPEEVRAAYDGRAVELHTNITVRIAGKRVETTVGRILLWEIMPKEEMLRLRHLMVKDAKSMAKIAKEAMAGQDFADLVAVHSESPDKENNGEIGLLKKEDLIRIFNADPDDVDDLFRLSASEISAVITTDSGIHLFQVMERRLEVPFETINMVMDKGALRGLVDYVYRNLGSKATVILADRLKDIGYKYSTKGGLSISIDAMMIPEKKGEIIKRADKQVVEIGRQYTEGLITQGEKYNKVVDIWAKATDDVANEMMDAMKMAPLYDSEGNPRLDESGQPRMAESFNPIYMMADSGARGSKDQMRQLAGMRGLMAKPSGEIIETPIQANFREGLSVLQYFISTHGARKGLADTALKTANSGYLTRRLADVAQDCAVVEHDCGTLLGVEVEPLLEGGEVIQRLSERILGRTTVKDILDPFTDEVIVKAGKELDEKEAHKIDNAGVTTVLIRSVLTCRTKHGVCAKCYGRDLAHGRTVEMGQAVGILAAQSIGEPGTQLTMRTFHIGGTASRRVEQADIRARTAGKIKFVDLNVVKNADNELVVMNRRGGEFGIVGETGRERERCPVIYGAHIVVREGQAVNPGDLLAVWDPFTTPIITEVDGSVKFGDLVPGKTIQEKVDPVTGKSSRTVIESKTAEERPRISIKGEDGKTAKLPKGSGMARYMLPVGAIVMVEEGDPVKAGDIIAKLPRATTKTKDITGGLPRVAELFEVRKPKEVAVLSEIDGYVSISKATKKGKQRVTITPVDVGEKKEYLIPRGKHINVYEGDYIRAGEPLIGGAANPQDILKIRGEVALAKYLVDEVQEVYRLQGVRINDKHIEVIVRQMMRRVKVVDIGDTDFILEEQVDKITFEEANEAIIAKGGKPAIAEPLILGITKASLSTDSFISAASFQETTKVLTDAAIAGAVDSLRGLKENVIMGRIIPAGTGIPEYRDLSVMASGHK